MALYKQDPNNTNKQIPDGTPGGTARYSHATCPKVATKQKRPTYFFSISPRKVHWAYFNKSG